MFWIVGCFRRAAERFPWPAPARAWAGGVFALAVVGAAAALACPARAAEGDRPVLRVVYFIPTDREPAPDHRARVERVLNHVRRFYLFGMRQNDHGDLTFELDRDARGALRLFEVKARGPMRDYGRDAAGKVGREVKEALAKEGLDADRETIVVFQLLLEWRGERAIEIGPYVGGGGPRGGMAWVYDDAKLDPDLLASREPGGYYAGACSLGQFNTHYIGGVAHELGHAFGLPHDRERDWERPRRGASLMGGGNHTYGQELRGEGRGAFLSPVSALPLSRHPLFTGKRAAAEAMTCQLDDLVAAHEKDGLILTGRFTSGPRVLGVAAHNDPTRPTGDYDAVGWICPVDAEGRFRLVVGELRPGDFQLRLAAYGASGDARRFAFNYQVDAQGRPDLWPFVAAPWLRRAEAAFAAGDKAELGKLAEQARRQHPEHPMAGRKVTHLLKLLTPEPPRPLAGVDAAVKEVLAADMEFEAAKVGWGRPLRDQVLVEGDAGRWLEVGGAFFESGLYAHAPARHALRLGGQWSEFATKYGLQDGHDGSVVFVVLGDGRELFRSPAVRDHVVREQVVKVDGVKLLELLVEDAGDGASSDWGVWLAPRLRRGK